MEQYTPKNFSPPLTGGHRNFRTGVSLTPPHTEEEVGGGLHKLPWVGVFKTPHTEEEVGGHRLCLDRCIRPPPHGIGGGGDDSQHFREPICLFPTHPPFGSMVCLFIVFSPPTRPLETWFVYSLSFPHPPTLWKHGREDGCI